MEFLSNKLKQIVFLFSKSNFLLGIQLLVFFVFFSLISGFNRPLFLSKIKYENHIRLYDGKKILFPKNASYIIEPPTVISYAPTSIYSGQTVIITGTNFYNVTSVKFNSTNAISYVVTGPNSITAVAPNNIVMGQISVTTALGTGKASTSYTVVNPPIPVSMISSNTVKSVPNDTIEIKKMQPSSAPINTAYIVNGVFVEASTLKEIPKEAIKSLNVVKRDTIINSKKFDGQIFVKINY